MSQPIPVIVCLVGNQKKIIVLAVAMAPRFGEKDLL